MALNIFKSDDQTLMLLEKQWSSELNPLLSNILTQGSMLSNVNIVTGSNTFNHYLGKQMTGWILIDQDSLASIYRSAPLNTKTLTLTSDANVLISLWIF